MILLCHLSSNPIFFGSISNITNSNYMYMYNDYHAFERHKEFYLPAARDFLRSWALEANNYCASKESREGEMIKTKRYSH